VVTTRKAAKGDKLNVAFNTFLRFRQKIDLDYANPTAASADQIRYEEMIFGKYGVALNEGIKNRPGLSGVHKEKDRLSRYRFHRMHVIPTGFIILYRKSEAVTVRLRTSRPVSRLH